MWIPRGLTKTNESGDFPMMVVHLHLQYRGLEGSVFENGKCQEPKVFGVNEGGENMLGLVGVC